VRRAIRWTLGVLGGLLLLAGGGSIFWQPADEVLYAAWRGPLACHSAGCVAIYTLEVGNTGREPQPDVRVALRAASLGGPPGVRVRDFGKVDRRHTVSEAAGIRTYGLGPLAPGDRVELSVTVLRPDREGFPEWEAMLAGVEPARGRAHAGNPGWTMLLRIWYMFARGV
jgi:hypothetical protein